MPLLTEEPIVRGAEISRCRRYRYTLERTWEPEGQNVLFVGLNPSTADAHNDDPTVRRCMGFARDWGFGGFQLINLFALRATDPALLTTAADPVGPENNQWIVRLAERAGLVVAAWGVHGTLLDRDKAVRTLLGEVKCLGRTRDGHPRHPLYLAKDTALEPF